MYGDQSSVTPIEEDEDVYQVGVINLDEIADISTESKDLFFPYVSEIGEKSGIVGNPLKTGFGTIFIENIEANILVDESESREIDIFHFTDKNKAKVAVQSRDISLCFIINKNFSK